MRKELGKWLMDLAKYVVTAFVISGLLGGIENVAVAILIGVSTASVCLAAGLSLVDDSAKEKKGNGRGKKRKRKR